MAEQLIEDDDLDNNQDEELLVVTDDQEDDQEDERVARDDQNDEREAIRERRRKEKAERKERKDTAIKRDKLELDFLRKRNDDLERRLTAQEERAFKTDLGTIDSAIQNAAREAQMAERVIAKAVEAGNGEDVTKAMRFRDEAIAKVQQLAQYKQQAELIPVQIGRAHV